MDMEMAKWWLLLIGVVSSEFLLLSEKIAEKDMRGDPDKNVKLEDQEALYPFL